MSLDHDSGEMDGEVLTGRFAGAFAVAAVGRGSAGARRELEADADSLGLLLAYLDRRRRGSAEGAAEAAAGARGRRDERRRGAAHPRARARRRARGHPRRASAADQEGASRPRRVGRARRVDQRGPRSCWTRPVSERHRRVPHAADAQGGDRSAVGAPAWPAAPARRLRAPGPSRPRRRAPRSPCRTPGQLGCSPGFRRHSSPTGTYSGHWRRCCPGCPCRPSSGSPRPP